MRKVILSFIIAFSLMLSVLPIASAHANYSAQHHVANIVPHATGGGCSQVITTGPMSGNSCISYSFISGSVFPDGYVSFNTRNFRGGVSSCSVRIELYEYKSYVTRDQYSCALAASQNKQEYHFGPTGHLIESNGPWYSLLKINISYNDGTFGFFTAKASPNVTA